MFATLSSVGSVPSGAMGFQSLQRFEFGYKNWIVSNIWVINIRWACRPPEPRTTRKKEY